MKKLLSIILFAFVSMTVLAQKEQATTLPPLVYEQEETGSHHPKPALPDAGLLPEIIELPNALQGVSSFNDWEQQIKPDQKIGNFWMMNGTIFEIEAKKHDDMPFLMPYSEQQNITATIKYDTDPTAPQTYDELLAKVKQTCHIYDRETSGGKTAAVVILHKMCDGYPHKLTQEQLKNCLFGNYSLQAI